MKKNEENYKRNVSHWYKILDDLDINLIKMRKFFNIPILGIQTSEEYTEYEKENKKNIKELKLLLNSKLRKSKIAYAKKFKGTLLCWVIFNELEKDDLYHIKLNDSDVLFYTGKEQLEKDCGYIKIDPYISIDALKKFIEDNKSEIESLQGKQKEKQNLPKKYIQSRASGDPERNERISFLNSLGKKKIEEIAERKGIILSDKTTMIVNILKFLNYDVSDSLVRNKSKKRKNYNL